MKQDPHITAQQQRENPDPHEKTNPIPWPLIILVALLFSFGIAYISTADIASPSSWGDGRVAEELSGSKKEGAVKVDGAALYASLCVACHQASGQGLPGVFPPLAGSEWVNGKDTTAVAIVLHGITGKLTVKGNEYNGVMPAFGGQLSNEQMAALLTHIRTQWGNSAPAVSAESVAQARDTFKDRTAPFAGAKELPPHD
ncbi:c-type cytochrome [Paucibacter sp. DJ2R-2]|uniref:c-type cytochrome n=1 Tax=Paucibacter sp. DJ2R-2 TaxID=2893558 RepID=UPI0021E4C4FC|nr:cytochrome c [Paucibacter sp. DJ2R-2]MCV2438678.1 cytochrome c [Paucibacter sp. DJ2R-2]